MKTIICGTRKLNNRADTERAIALANLPITLVISGCAAGPDSFGADWAKANSIDVDEKPADWDNLQAPDALIRINKHGKLYNARAGFTRNSEMIKNAEAVIAVWDGKSRGTKDTIDKAADMGLPVMIYYPSNKKFDRINYESS